MKIFLSFLLSIFSLTGFSQTTLTFTPLSGDFTAPNKGAQHWGTSDWGAFNATPTIPAGNTTPKNFYTRFNWRDIESSTVQGTYDFTAFDAYVNKAIDSGAMFSFGLMAFCTACNGAPGQIPAYLVTLMANEGKPGPVVGGFTYPNYQSTNWKNRYSALMRVVANHIAVTSHSGHSYTSAFLGYDIRHSGDFGEGVGLPSPGTIPSSAQITTAYMMSMIDTAIAIYPNVQLTIPMNYVAPNNNYNLAAGNPDAQSAWYALTKPNNYGRIGWRRDNIGDDGYNGYLTGTTATYNPGTGAVSLLNLIMNAWKTAPIGGEPAFDYCGSSRCGSIYCDVHNEDTLFHMTYFGNGNYPIAINANGTVNCSLNTPQNTTNGGDSLISHMRAASAEQGYRLVLTGGTMTTNILSGNAFNITMNWQNTGLAPVYENWKVVYELRNGGGTVVWSGISRFTPKLLLPSTSATTVSDNFSMNNSVTPATYTMYIIIRDPAGYKAPLPLAITGRQSDGSYAIRAGIVMISSPTTDSLTLVKIWGESNAAGNAPNTDAPAAELGVRAGVKIWNHTSHVFESLNIGTNNQQDDFGIGGRHGLELSMANEVDSGHLPNPTYLIKNGVSGSFIGQWMPGAEGDAFRPPAPPIGGSLWDGWELTYGVAGVTAINALAKPYRFYEWQSIGLNDEFGQITPIDSFVNRMARFRARSRTLYSNSNIIFLGTNFNNPPESTLPTNWENVYRLTIPQQDPKYHEAPVLGATYMDHNPASHFDYWGLKLIGKNMVDTMLSLQGTPTGGGGGGVAAYAGPDQTITLPVSSVTLNATGTAGTITSYSWTQVSGPNTASIATPTTITTNVTGLIQGTYTFQMSVNAGVSTDQVLITVNPAVPPGMNIFTTQIPASNTTNNDGPQGGITGIETGVKFRSTVAGYIIGVRFYKTAGNTGTHVGELYNSTGTRLAQATYGAETATGWQTVGFTTPIFIAANTTYIAAYFSPLGNYIGSNNYFTAAVVNTNLSALADGTDGPNGLYKYTATAAFPNLSYQKGNYWIDVVFTITPPNVIIHRRGAKIYFK
jgi:Domain of unknown function (DUF4082)/K319L-like, PKD domain/Domain of unknown function (DUF4832)